MTRLKIPLKFNKAPIWPTHLDPPALRYSQSTYTAASGASPQPVLDGRSILSPDIDLNDFRCTAVIDWIEVRMQNTPGLHQARNIHFHAKKMLDKLGSQSTIFVSGPDGETGYIDHDFILRLQQPVAREMMEFLEEMLQYYRPRNPKALCQRRCPIGAPSRAKTCFKQPMSPHDPLRHRGGGAAAPAI